MRFRRFALVVVAAVCAQVASAGLNMNLAYHDDGDGEDDRAVENLPGRAETFLGNGGTSIPNSEPVVLYVMTANQFAGDAEEQVFVRWWNGQEEHWIMGSWLANVVLGSGDESAGRFHGQPGGDDVMVDLWRVEIGADITQPGENFYVIQLKGWNEEGSSEEGYLLREKGDQDGVNDVGQVYVVGGDYFGRDWSVTIDE
jgi:hypothetical protein